jgi:hypothetical protein
MDRRELAWPAAARDRYELDLQPDLSLEIGFCRTQIEKEVCRSSLRPGSEPKRAWRRHGRPRASFAGGNTRYQPSIRDRMRALSSEAALAQRSAKHRRAKVPVAALRRLRTPATAPPHCGHRNISRTAAHAPGCRWADIGAGRSRRLRNIR